MKTKYTIQFHHMSPLRYTIDHDKVSFDVIRKFVQAHRDEISGVYFTNEDNLLIEVVFPELVTQFTGDDDPMNNTMEPGLSAWFDT